MRDENDPIPNDLNTSFIQEINRAQIQPMNSILKNESILGNVLDIDLHQKVDLCNISIILTTLYRYSDSSWEMCDYIYENKRIINMPSSYYSLSIDKLKICIDCSFIPKNISFFTVEVQFEQKGNLDTIFVVLSEGVYSFRKGILENVNKQDKIVESKALPMPKQFKDIMFSKDLNYKQQLDISALESKEEISSLKLVFLFFGIGLICIIISKYISRKK
ncbi:hypothetical protein NUSPORA_00420 [Nucleospora cyclopteri]